MLIIRLLKKIHKQEKRIQELQDIIVENEKNNAILIAQHIKMLEWVDKTNEEINELRKERDEK